MSFWGKVWIRVEAVLKAALGLVFFLCIDYAVLYSFFFFKIDTRVYRGITNLSVTIVTITIMLVINKVSSTKEDPLFRMEKLTPDQIASLVMISVGMLGFVTLYITMADRISEYLESLKEAVEEYRESVDRFSDVPQVAVPVWDQILYVINLCFIVPVAEEMTFRGVVFGQLRKGFRPWFAVVLSATIFGLFHGISVHIGYAIACGIIIAACYYLTDSLVAPVIIHMVFNILGSGLANFMRIDGLNIPSEATSAMMTGINTTSLIFMPVAAIAIAYLVSVRRGRILAAAKNEIKEESEDGTTAEKSEESGTDGIEAPQ